MPAQTPDAQINAVEFQEFLNASHTQDGSHALLQFKAAQGNFTIALPGTELPKLMTVLSTISAKIAQLLTGKKQATIFPCTLWNFAPDAAGDAVNLSFRIPGNMEMTFQVSKKQIPLMRDALSAAETGTPVVPLVGRID